MAAHLFYNFTCQSIAFVGLERIEGVLIVLEFKHGGVRGLLPNILGGCRALNCQYLRGSVQ
ncbi:hypothetical protein D1872_287800 [compost metagenome]